MKKNRSYQPWCRIYLCMALSLTFSFLSAQNSNNISDRSTDQSNHIVENEIQYSYQDPSSASILQVGDDNRALVNQLREINQPGLNAQISQYGNENEMILNQVGGSQNFTAIQDGFGNLISSSASGANHQVYIEQNGQDNVIHQELSGTTEGVFILTQQGVDHEIYHTKEGNAPTLEVHQTGFGAKVTIEQQ